MPVSCGSKNPPSRPRWLALLPAGLIALLTFSTGTFAGAASSLGAVSTHAALLGFCLLGSPDWRDPLRLGNPGRWLLPLALLFSLVSWQLSPVARAGRVGLLLLPALLLAPAATHRCWRSESARRTGVLTVSGLALLAGGIALVSWQMLDLPRPALPLGHHNLLAGWLVMVLPLSLIPIGYTGHSRWVGVAAGLCGLAALCMSESLMGGIALAAQIAAATIWWPRARKWLIPAILVLALLGLPRLVEVGRGVDPSTRARATYLAAGWRGLVERPVVGWGPGAVAWTIGEHMAPAAQVNPASEVVGDLHCLPAELAYELGVLGTILGSSLCGIFAFRRLLEVVDSTDPSVQRAALLGLLGAAVFSLGSAPLAVPALPATAAVIAGAALGPGSAENRSRPSRRRIIAGLYSSFAILALIPLDSAHLLYDRARRAEDPEAALEALQRAVRLDPRFPLYRAREAWLRSELEGPTLQAAAGAREAAAMAPGLAPLWLAAGDLARRAAVPWAVAAFAQAHRLDPLSPLTSFHTLVTDPERSDAVDLGTYVVEAEPRLAAATFWCSHPDLAREVSERTGMTIPNGQAIPSQVPSVLALTMDRVPAVSFSLYAFRRSPWPASLAPVLLEPGPCQTLAAGVQ